MEAVIMLHLFAFVLLLLAVKAINRLLNFRCSAKTCLVGKVAIVTGGNSGIGYQTVLDLASRGCKIIIADITNGEEIVAKIREETGNQNIIWKYIDLGSLDSVREFASAILNSETRLDILINNAGCAGLEGYTADGLQKVMQINYFGHFLLTHLLVGLLKATKNSRVISVSSILAFTNMLNSPKLLNKEPKLGINIAQLVCQYGNSKLCVLIAMKVMAEKLRKHGIGCYSVHPGAIGTMMVKSTFANSRIDKISQFVYMVVIQFTWFAFGKTTMEGAQTALHCALSKEAETLSGKHFWNGTVFWEPPVAYNKQFCQELWEESEKLVKLRLEEKLI